MGNNTALLVVDVQKGFINAHTAHIVQRVEQLLDKYQHIFCAKFFNPQGSFYRRLLHWHEIERGSKDHEFAFKVPQNALIIEKSTYSCVSKSFVQLLKRRGIRRIDLCGLDTEICVTKSAVDLIERGPVPRVLAHYCASSGGEQFHQWGLEVLKRFIGEGQLIFGDLKKNNKGVGNE